MTGHTHTKQLLWLTAATLILTAAWAAPAHPASTLVFKAVAIAGKRGKGPAGRIYCGPDSVMTLAGRGWQSVLDAREVARRLNLLAEEGIHPEDIRIHRRRTSHIITARTGIRKDYGNTVLSRITLCASFYAGVIIVTGETG